MWDLYYRGKIEKLNVPYPLLNSIKTKLVATGNYKKAFFTAKYHK